jgi:hypothetical protein
VEPTRRDGDPGRRVVTGTRSLAEEVEILRRQVDGLQQRFDDREGHEFPPVDWSSLDREQARDEWDRLTEFVDWLVQRYGLAETIPGCWYRHPPMLEELSALRTGWFGTYVDPTADADAGLAWHENLEKVLLRIREWDRTGCAAGTHRDDHPLPAAVTDDRRVFIDDDIEARPDPADTADGSEPDANGDASGDGPDADGPDEGPRSLRVVE